MFYAKIKGVLKSERQKIVKHVISELDLDPYAQIQAGQLRLAILISLMKFNNVVVEIKEN
jgi:hypothetical protein